jgi:ubiquinone biosynthesis monooxygenase Coq7
MLVESIVRVDHAGELAADRIYAGQLAVLRAKSHSGIAPAVQRMWDEEKEHLDTMERLCAKNQVSPTIFSPLCSAAGFALGAVTSLMGEKSAMACTIAVEELIGQHYNDQIRELVDDDVEEHEELLKVDPPGCCSARTTAEVNEIHAM